MAKFFQGLFGCILFFGGLAIVAANLLGVIPLPPPAASYSTQPGTVVYIIGGALAVVGMIMCCNIEPSKPTVVASADDDDDDDEDDEEEDDYSQSQAREDGFYRVVTPREVAITNDGLRSLHHERRYDEVKRAVYAYLKQKAFEENVPFPLPFDYNLARTAPVSLYVGGLPLLADDFIAPEDVEEGPLGSLWFARLQQAWLDVKKIIQRGQQAEQQLAELQKAHKRVTPVPLHDSEPLGGDPVAAILGRLRSMTLSPNQAYAICKTAIEVNIGAGESSLSAYDFAAQFAIDHPMKENPGGYQPGMKLDGKFHGAVYRHSDGKVVPDDQWVVFVAKDNAFPATLRFYRSMCEKIGAEAEQIAAVERLIGRVDVWRDHNRDLLKIPDAAPGECH